MNPADDVLDDRGSGSGNRPGSALSRHARSCGPPADAQMPITDARRGRRQARAAWSRREPALSRARGWRITWARLSVRTRCRKAAPPAPAGLLRSRSSLARASSAPAASADAAFSLPADVAGQHQDRQRPGAHDLLDGLEPVHAGQLDVHGHQVRLHAGQGGDRLLGRGADRVHRDIAVVLEHPPQRGGVGPRVLAEQHGEPHPVRYLPTGHRPTSRSTVASRSC